MNTESLSQLRQRLLYEGLCDVGFSRIDETVPPDLARYHYAVTLMYRLSDAIVDEIDASPTYAYFQHYRAANALLDRCALITCEFLRREGAAAYPINRQLLPRVWDGSARAPSSSHRNTVPGCVWRPSSPTRSFPATPRLWNPGAETVVCAWKRGRPEPFWAKTMSAAWNAAKYSTRKNAPAI